MSVNKERWIDLVFLTQGIDSTADGMTMLVYDCDVDILKHSHTYLLRRALRDVGFKITRINLYHNQDDRPNILEYYTNIPETVWKTKMEFFREWTRSVSNCYHPESDEQSESESDDPVAEK
jgi:hypothetical protein